MKHIGRIKVIDKIADDIMDTVCICPHCGSQAIYGEMFTLSGIHGCTKCQEELNDVISYDREHYYEVYIRKANNFEYEPYRYIKEFE